jgi:hypothetical protein
LVVSRSCQTYRQAVRSCTLPSLYSVIASRTYALRCGEARRLRHTSCHVASEVEPVLRVDPEQIPKNSALEFPETRNFESRSPLKLRFPLRFHPYLLRPRRP